MKTCFPFEWSRFSNPLDICSSFMYINSLNFDQLWEQCLINFMKQDSYFMSFYFSSKCILMFCTGRQDKIRRKNMFCSVIRMYSSKVKWFSYSVKCLEAELLKPLVFFFLFKLWSIDNRDWRIVPFNLFFKFSSFGLKNVFKHLKFTFINPPETEYIYCFTLLTQSMHYLIYKIMLIYCVSCMKLRSCGWFTMWTLVQFANAWMQSSMVCIDCKIWIS